MRGRQFESGDHVAWRHGARRVTGQVLRKAICRFGVAGQFFDASPKAPRVLIRRDDDGKLAVLTPGDLHALPS
jgi:hypothetical protein